MDGQVLAQSQAIVRYLARRGDMAGNSSLESVQMDMLAEAVAEVLNLLVGAPFTRAGEGGAAAWEEKQKVVRVKWNKLGRRLEELLQRNRNGTRKDAEMQQTSGGEEATVFLVGTSLSYADVLAAHVLTWAVEELGADCVRTMPMLVDLQVHVLSLPHMQAFTRSPLYYPLGDDAYVQEVLTTLGR
jgi:glutathione S-transferase